MSTEPQVGASAEPGARIRLWAVALCAFCPFLAIYATQPLLPSPTHIFAADAKEVSLTITATTLAIAVAAPFSGLVADAIGRKLVIVACILGLSVPTALAASASSLEQLIAWRFVQGLFIPAIFSVTLAYIGDEWASRNVGLGMSAYVSGGVVGSVLGRVVSGPVADLQSWRASFLVLAAVICVGGLAVWLVLPRSRHFERQRNIGDSLRNMARQLKRPGLVAIFVCAFNNLFVFVGVFTYITFYFAKPPFLRQP
jgi:MFS family permease